MAILTVIYILFSQTSQATTLHSTKTEFLRMIEKPMMREFCQNPNSMIRRCFRFDAKDCQKSFRRNLEICGKSEIHAKLISKMYEEDIYSKRMGRCIGEQMAKANLKRFDKGDPECSTRESWQ